MSSESSSTPRLIIKKQFRVKKQKKKLFRINESVLSVFMWGINHTINELSLVNIPVILLPDDFRAYSKIRVDNHRFNKENMSSHFRVKEYCPLVFRNLREHFGVDDVDYRDSLTLSQPIQFAPSGKNGDQPKWGRSRYFHSYDKYFMLKSLSSQEVERMHAFLEHYHPYIVERHGITLLPQYLGMYRLTVNGLHYYFLVMRNIFRSYLPIHQKFELNGSKVNRETSNNDSLTINGDNQSENHLPTLKDNDMIEHKIQICIGEEAKQKLFDKLNADINFLTKLHLMDYTLLVGIHNLATAEKTTLSKENFVSEESEIDEKCTYNTPPDSPRFIGQYNNIIQDIDIYALHSIEDRREIYFIAITNVHMKYGVKKQQRKAAKAAKRVKHCSEMNQKSITCNPEQYAKRFIEFMGKAIE